MNTYGVENILKKDVTVVAFVRAIDRLKTLGNELSHELCGSYH